MNRRAFLHLSGLVALGSLLQACGGGAAPAASSAAPASAPPPASKPAPASAPAKPASSGAASASSKPAASAAPGSAAAKPGTPKLKVTYGAVVGSFLPLWVAKEIGAFEKYGVNVDMQFVATATAIQAQIGKEIDVQEVSAAPVITADVNGGEDLVMIASALNHPIIALYADKSIKTANDLKGKALGSDKPGTPLDYAARLSLSLLGLKPTDVEMRPLGGGAVFPAMLSGQMPAGMVAPPQTYQLEAQGFHLMQDIYSKPYQNVALVAKKSRLDELASGIRPLLAAYRDALAAIYNQPDVAMKVQDQYGKVGDPTILKKNQDFYTKIAPFQRDMQPTTEGIQAMIDFLASSIVPKAKGHKPAEFVDLRFLNDLPK